MFIRSLLIIAALIFSFSLSALAAQSDRHGDPAHKASTTDADTPKPVNDVCPIGNEPIDEEVETRTWRGHVIGFCCSGCDTKWDAKTEAEKDEFLAKYVKDKSTSQTLGATSQLPSCAPLAESE